jgi:hypothetical protein
MPTTPYVDPDSVAIIGTGDPVPSSMFATYRDNFEMLARPPGCVVSRVSPAVSHANDTATALSFSDADSRDTDGYHTPFAPNHADIVIPAGLGGWYSLIGWVNWSANSTGRRQWTIEINGSQQPGGMRVITNTDGAATTLPVAAEYRLNAGDVVRLMCAQNSGGALNVTGRLAVRMVAQP